MGRAASGNRIRYGRRPAGQTVLSCVYSLLNAPPDVRRRAEQISLNWQGWITWHPHKSIGGGGTLARRNTAPTGRHACAQSMGHIERSQYVIATGIRETAPPWGQHHHEGRLRQPKWPGGRSTNRQSWHRSCQYVYVLRCRACGHEYGANGSDIWLRRCPAHDRGAPGLPY